VLIFSLAMTPWPTGGLAAVQLLLGQSAAAGLLTLAWTRHRPTQTAVDGPWRPSVVGSHGGGMLCLLGLLFLYYAGYDLPLPFDQILLLPFAALLLAMAARPRSPGAAAVTAGPQRPIPRTVLAVVAALIALPLLAGGGGDSTSPANDSPAATHDLRVMTYNLHCGFGARGYLRLEEQAAVIASQRPDIVALQEVSRGWIINGGVDVLAWLAHRLDMDYRFAPTADPLWGNATLSRRPIVASHHLDYPSDAQQQIRRGLVEISVAADGDAVPWNVINTHFHHRRSDSGVRVEQASVLLETWGGRPRTLLLGDLNATPESPEMGVLRDAGLGDSVGARLGVGAKLGDGGLGDGYTFRADALDRRIDYIWLSPDLRSHDLVIVPSTASDHLAIAATVGAVEVTAPAAAPDDLSTTAPPPVP
jgi:endonuclease/exonuclease/phosphatase family metal-dependent hydrolase